MNDVMHAISIATNEMMEYNMSLAGNITFRRRSTTACQMVKTNKMGGKIRLTRLLGMKMIRNTITTNAITKNGTYCFTPSLICSPLRRNSNDSKMNTTSHENSSSSFTAIIRKLLVRKC